MRAQEPAFIPLPPGAQGLIFHHRLPPTTLPSTRVIDWYGCAAAFLAIETHKTIIETTTLDGHMRITDPYVFLQVPPYSTVSYKLCGTASLSVYGIAYKIPQESPPTPQVTFTRDRDIFDHVISLGLAGSEALHKILPIHSLSDESPVSSLARRLHGILTLEFRSRLRIADLAQALGLTPSALSHTMTRNFGISPHAYLRLLRAKEAAFQMVTSGCSATEAAQEVGFYDSSQLYHALRAVMGLTPRGLQRATHRGLVSAHSPLWQPFHSQAG